MESDDMAVEVVQREMRDHWERMRSQWMEETKKAVQRAEQKAQHEMRLRLQKLKSEHEVAIEDTKQKLAEATARVAAKLEDVQQEASASDSNWNSKLVALEEQHKLDLVAKLEVARDEVSVQHEISVYRSRQYSALRNLSQFSRKKLLVSFYRWAAQSPTAAVDIAWEHADRVAAVASFTSCFLQSVLKQLCRSFNQWKFCAHQGGATASSGESGAHSSMRLILQLVSVSSLATQVHQAMTS
jgi:hypothetical protein